MYSVHSSATAPSGFGASAFNKPATTGFGGGGFGGAITTTTSAFAAPGTTTGLFGSAGNDLEMF